MYHYLILSIIYLVWVLVFLIIMSHMDIINNNNISFGPGNDKLYLLLKIDNWSKWIVVSFYVYITRFLARFLECTAVKWLNNNLRNETKYINFLEHNRIIYVHLITQIYHIAYFLDYIICIIIIVNKCDILIFGILAECTVIYMTTKDYIQIKDELLVNNNDNICYPLNEPLGSL